VIPEFTPFKFVILKKAATEKQKEVRRHSFVMFILAGARRIFFTIFLRITALH